MKLTALFSICLLIALFSCTSNQTENKIQSIRTIAAIASHAKMLRDSERIDSLMIAVSIAEKEGIQDSLTAIIYHQAAIYWYLKANTESYEKALNLFNKALVIRKNVLAPNDPILAKTYLNIGKCQKYLSQYYRGIYSFSEALKNYKSQADTISLMEVYREMGDTYDEIGDYQAAINYFNLSSNFQKINDSTNQEVYDNELAKTYHLAGISAFYSRQLTESEVFFQKALPFFKQLEDTIKIARIFHQLGMVKSEKKAFPEAIHYFNQALKYNPEEIEKAHTRIEIAKTYIELKQLMDAKDYAEQSLNIRKILDTAQLPEAYQVLGEIAEAQQKPDSALFFYQKALQSIDLTFKNNDILTNPTIDAKTFNRKIELIQLLAHKGGVLPIISGPLSIKAKLAKNKAYLEAALRTYQLADELVQVLRRQMQDDQSKYFWNETALPIYKKAMDVASQLWDLTQDEQYKLTILQFAERTKAPVLREGIADNEAKGFAGVPASDRQRERELRATIAILEKQTDNNAQTTTFLTKTRTQLYDFQDSLKTKYPIYARYLDATNQEGPLSINALKSTQSQLSDSTLLIEYAFGETDVYQIAVSNTDFKIFKTPLTPNFYTQIDRFIQSVSNVDAIRKDFNAASKDYAETSFDAYQRLLEQPLKAFNAKMSIKRIQLVLDNKLHLLPFKALTDSPVKGWTGDYPKHFLVQQYAFSSLFSCQNLIQKDPSVSTDFSTDFKLACFGLDFKEDSIWRQKTPKTSVIRKKNNVLVNAEPETKGIASQFNGRFYFNQTATKDTFLKVAPQYDVLHITTHGYPEGLVFQKKNAADSLNDISIGDIYRLPLHTRFTFLSACETGQGKITEAEGVMSLGRAFTFAGSQSVLMTLWSISDGSTSTIAQNFYTYCHQGIPKDVAEQRAEIDYLNSIKSDKQALPINWAALTIIGDMSPLEGGESTSKWWIWGLLAGVTVVVGFRVLKRDSSQV